MEDGSVITWNESMSTGIQRLDDQHRMLFQKFNEFSKAMSNMSARESASEVLDFLQFYANWHFGQEENCMEEYRCPAASMNKQAHAEFIKTFNEFYEQWQQGTMTSQLAAATYTELERWLVNHILRVDTQLSPCVLE